MRATLLFVAVLPATVLAQIPAELTRRADHFFFKAEDMKKAEQIYRRVMAHPDASIEERSNAHRYACACVGRRGELAKAVEMHEEWLAAYPRHAKRHYTLFFQGLYLRRLGREKAAVAAWQTILAESPNPRIAERARLELDRDTASERQPRRVRRPPIRYFTIYRVVNLRTLP